MGIFDKILAGLPAILQAILLLRQVFNKTAVVTPAQIEASSAMVDDMAAVVQRHASKQLGAGGVQPAPGK